MNDKQFIIIVIVLALSVMISRYLPFILFKDTDKLPDIINYLGNVLPSAMMGLLVVYCFKDYNFFDMSEILPAMIAAIVVVILHLYKHNSILSILFGTLTYIVLLNMVF